MFSQFLSENTSSHCEVVIGMLLEVSSFCLQNVLKNRSANKSYTNKSQGGFDQILIT